jgi:hypothetical protein
LGHSLEDKKDETIIEKCDRFRTEGATYKKAFEADKEEQERFYNGEHWKEKSVSNRPKNHVWQIVESEIPLLMDPMPATDILAHDEANHGDHAIVLKAAKDHVYRQQNMFLKYVQAIRASLKTGSGYLYIDYDPDGEKGEGSVTVNNTNRKQVTRDPAADHCDQARYTIIDSALANEDLKRRFPKTYEEAISQPMKDLFVFAGTKGAREEFNTDQASDKKANRFESEDMTFIEEYWLKDYSMEEIPDDETQIQLTEESAQLMQGINPDISKWEDHAAHLQGHEDQKNVILQEALATMGLSPEMATQADIDALKQDEQIGLILNIIDDHIEMHQMHIENMDQDEIGKRPKYPNNLRLVIKTGKIVHYDGAPPVDDGIVPLVEFECYKDEGPAEGIIKNIIPMQKTVNELDAKELKGLKLATNPGWVMDKQSGVDSDTLTDEDGLVVEKEQGTEVQRLSPGQVSVQLENRSRREYEAMNRIEGVGETIFGEAPKGDPSGVMLRRLQQQALGRIRLKSRMIEAAVHRTDLLILSRVMKYWSTERKLRSEDANGTIKFVKFDPRMMRDFTYELSMPMGTSVSHDAETIAATYKELLIAGAIDLKTFATLTDLPKKQDLLRLLGEQDQAAAALQEAQMQVKEAQKQMLMMKANLAPQTLAPEEIKMVEQMALEEQQAQITQNPMNTAVE